MKIAVNGASGFIGGELCRFFRAQGHEVVAIPRAVYADKDALKNLIGGCDAVINLAGASIAARWSEAYKKRLRTSRIDTTRAGLRYKRARKSALFHQRFSRRYI